MQKDFIFLLIIWNSSLSASGNQTNPLQLLLGCQAVIPCQYNRSDSNSFKWFYKKDEHSNTIRIYFQDKKGVEYQSLLFHSRMKVHRNGSLVLDPLTEEDQGLYWCENCDICREQPTVISVKKEILKETHETVTQYVIEGGSFSHECPGELTNLKWTFEASNMTALRNSVQGSQSYIVTSNKFIHIVNVTRADAGKYTCCKKGCDGHRQKLLTINLCVITVHHSEDSSVSCAAMCDIEFSSIRPNSTINVETGTRTISVRIDPNRSLKCSEKQMFDGYSVVNSTHGSSNALNKTTDIPTGPGHLIPVIYGISAALTCLILMALFICYLKRRLGEVFPVHLCCWGLNGRVEEETSVVYSSLVIETTNNPMTYSDSSCVYSEIKV